jgi:hypothetical protein
MLAMRKMKTQLTRLILGLLFMVLVSAAFAGGKHKGHDKPDKPDKPHHYGSPHGHHHP